MSPKCVSSLEKGFSQSPGMMFSPQHETLRLLKLHFGRLVLSWWCRDGFNPTKCSRRGTSVASGRRRLSAATQGNLLGNAFWFAKMVKRQRGGKKIRSHLHAEHHILARTNLSAVPAALVRRYLPASPSHADEWKDAGPALRRRMEAWGSSPTTHFSLCPRHPGLGGLHALSPCTFSGGAVGYFHGAPKGECPISRAARGGRGLAASRQVQEGKPAQGNSSPGNGRAGAVWFPASALPSGEHHLSLRGSRSVL